MIMGEGGAASPEVREVVSAIRAFCCREAPERSGEQLGQDLIALRRGLEWLEVEFSHTAAAFAETDEYQGYGSVCPVAWISEFCRMGSYQAAERVCVGTHAESLSSSLEAMTGGEIGFAHLALMARTVEFVSKSPTARSFDEGALLEKARDHGVKRFRDFCGHARHALDPKGVAAEQADLVRARSLEFSSSGDGSVYLRGFLDPVGGAAVRAALEPLAGKSGADDDRLRDRRLADALVELATHAHKVGMVKGRRAHLQVSTSLETLLGMAGAAGAELEFSVPISSQSVQRLACDCNISRVLLDSKSMVVDVGRSRRVVGPSTRRALNQRDGGCRWPGCDRNAHWSEAHHLVHWIREGPTDLSNLVLLCNRHHWMVHEGGWRIAKREDGSLDTFAPATRFTQWELMLGRTLEVA